MASKINVDPTQQVYVLQDLLQAIEALRLKRRDQWSGHRHPLQKRFTQEEIMDGPCPTYQNLLLGRSRRLPDRQTIMNIADYLECTITERNALLISAQYLPEKAVLEGEELDLALAETQRLMDNLTIPVYALNFWHIYSANDLLLRALNIADRRETFLQHTIGPAMYFDPDGLRPHLDYAPGVFEENVVDCLRFMRHHHSLLQHEAWYKDLIDSARQYPDFSRLWDSLGQETPLEIIQTKKVRNSDRILHVRSVMIRPYHTFYPSMIGLVPVDRATADYFMQLGMPNFNS